MLKKLEQGHHIPLARVVLPWLLTKEGRMENQLSGEILQTRAAAVRATLRAVSNPAARGAP